MALSRYRRVLWLLLCWKQSNGALCCKSNGDFHWTRYFHYTIKSCRSLRTTLNSFPLCFPSIYIVWVAHVCETRLSLVEWHNSGAHSLLPQSHWWSESSIFSEALLEHHRERRRFCLSHRVRQDGRLCINFLLRRVSSICWRQTLGIRWHVPNCKERSSDCEIYGFQLRSDFQSSSGAGDDRKGNLLCGQLDYVSKLAGNKVSQLFKSKCTTYK